MSNAANPTKGSADRKDTSADQPNEDSLKAQTGDHVLFWSVVITGLLVLAGLAARGLGLLHWRGA